MEAIAVDAVELPELGHVQCLNPFSFRVSEEDQEDPAGAAEASAAMGSTESPEKDPKDAKPKCAWVASLARAKSAAQALCCKKCVGAQMRSDR